MEIIKRAVQRWFKGGFLKGGVRYKRWAGIGSSMLLGIIFVTSGVGKIDDPSELITLLSYNSFLPHNIILLIAYWLPWVELLLGLYLIVGLSAKIFSGVSCFLVAGFIFTNAWLITRGLANKSCGCFGGIENALKIERQVTLTSQGALYMDIGMLVLILVILLYYPGKFLSLEPWWWFLTRRKITGNSRNNEGT